MTFGERLRKLRKALDLTQAEMAERVGSSAGTWTNYEKGHRNPSRSVINNICKTFSVNEEWLCTGAGAMFVQRTRSDEISALVDGLMADEPDSFRRRFVAALSHLDLDAWEAVEAFARSLVDGKGDSYPTDEQAIDREVEAYRQQLLASKKAAGKSSASSGTPGA